MNKKLFLLFIIFFIFFSFASAIERRKEQFPTEFGYSALPFPYIIPGSGSGLALAGVFNNIPFGSTETTLDFYAIGLVAGNITGNILVLSDLPIYPKSILLDIGQGSFSNGSFKTYRNRSMDSDPNDYLISELEDTNFRLNRMILTFFDRMFEISIFNISNQSTLSGIRDKKGNLIYEANQKFEFDDTSYSSQIDWTDDRIDPLKGIRFEYSQSNSNANDDDSPSYVKQDYNLTAYLPVLKSSTIAANWYRNGAIIKKQGNTDLDYLIAKQTATCLANCDSDTIQTLAENQLETNKYGNAGTLGGTSRLRSYDGGRYSGAQIEFRGVEFRWNVSDEKTPFDWYVVKDIALGWQLAFFYEEGSVSDVQRDLWKIKRTSTGIGARAVTSSGFVYRFDVAKGQEGTSQLLIFNYPWVAFSN